MNSFQQIKAALEYIDTHLDEDLALETLARAFHLSPYYFHRMFTVIVGKPIAIYIRDRRMLYACIQLASTGRSVLEIGMDSGYDSAGSFSRVFKRALGLSPLAYRQQGYVPQVITVDELIMRFTNRLKGGILVNPNIIKRDALMIAGVSGDGNRTAEVWGAFERLCKEKPLTNSISQNGYEIRLHDQGISTVHVGYAVSDDAVDSAYALYTLPASQYAAFDVYVANGYDSENNAMNTWLCENAQGYVERLLGNAHYCVEYYDERFSGDGAGSIVEIWAPITKENAALGT